MSFATKVVAGTVGGAGVLGALFVAQIAFA